MSVVDCIFEKQSLQGVVEAWYRAERWRLFWMHFSRLL